MIDGYDDNFSTTDRKTIDVMPTVDIVRCKDCKYWRNHGKEYPTYCERPDLWDLYADDYGVEMNADDFCSRGEKRC